MTNQPAYRVEWRANKTGTWAHAVITDIHDWVTTALLEDPAGGPYTDDDLDRMLADCLKRNRLVRPSKASDKLCASCLHTLDQLDRGIDLAALQWAIGKLDQAIEVLAEVAPIGPPEHVTGG